MQLSDTSKQTGTKMGSFGDLRVTKSSLNFDSSSNNNVQGRLLNIASKQTKNTLLFQRNYTQKLLYNINQNVRHESISSESSRSVKVTSEEESDDNNDDLLSSISSAGDNSVSIPKFQIMIYKVCL